MLKVIVDHLVSIISSIDHIWAYSFIRACMCNWKPVPVSQSRSHMHKTMATTHTCRWHWHVCARRVHNHIARVVVDASIICGRSRDGCGPSCQPHLQWSSIPVLAIAYIYPSTYLVQMYTHVHWLRLRAWDTYGGLLYCHAACCYTLITTKPRHNVLFCYLTFAAEANYY